MPNTHENVRGVKYVGGFEKIRNDFPHLSDWSDEDIAITLQQNLPQFQNWSPQEVYVSIQERFGNPEKLGKFQKLLKDMDAELEGYTTIDAIRENWEAGVNRLAKFDANIARIIPSTAATFLTTPFPGAPTGLSGKVGISQMELLNSKAMKQLSSATEKYAQAVESTDDIFEIDIPLEYQKPPEHWWKYFTDPRRAASALQSAPEMGLMLAGTAVNPILGMALMYSLEGGEVVRSLNEYEKRTGKKVNPLIKYYAPAISATLNAALEKVGINKILRVAKGIPGAAQLKAKLIQGAMATITEGGTEVLQEIAPMLTEMGYDEEARNFNDRLTDFAAALQGGLTLGGAASSIAATFNYAQDARANQKLDDYASRLGMRGDDAADFKEHVFTEVKENGKSFREAVESYQPIYEGRQEAKAVVEDIYNVEPPSGEEITKKVRVTKGMKDLLAEGKDQEIRAIYQSIMNNNWVKKDLNNKYKSITEDEFVELIRNQPEGTDIDPVVEEAVEVTEDGNIAKTRMVDNEKTAGPAIEKNGMTPAENKVEELPQKDSKLHKKENIGTSEVVATYVGKQYDPVTKRNLNYYNISADIPGHAAGSTVTAKQLKDAGIKVPKGRGTSRTSASMPKVDIPQELDPHVKKDLSEIVGRVKGFKLTDARLVNRGKDEVRIYKGILPDGSNLRIEIGGKIELTEEEVSIYQEAHGKKGKKIRPAGRYLYNKYTNTHTVILAKKRNVATLYHEFLHLARGGFSKKTGERVGGLFTMKENERIDKLYNNVYESAKKLIADKNVEETFTVLYGKWAAYKDNRTSRYKIFHDFIENSTDKNVEEIKRYWESVYQGDLVMRAPQFNIGKKSFDSVLAENKLRYIRTIPNEGVVLKHESYPETKDAIIIRPENMSVDGIKRQVNEYLNKYNLSENGKQPLSEKKETKRIPIDFVDPKTGAMRTGEFVKMKKDGFIIKFDENGEMVRKLIPNRHLRYNREKHERDIREIADKYDISLAEQENISFMEMANDIARTVNEVKLVKKMKNFVGKIGDYFLSFGEIRRLKPELSSTFMKTFHGVVSATDRAINTVRRLKRTMLTQEQAMLAAIYAEDKSSNSVKWKAAVPEEEAVDNNGNIKDGYEKDDKSGIFYKNNELQMDEVSKQEGDFFRKFLDDIGELLVEEGILKQKWPDSLVEANKERIDKIETKRSLTKNDRKTLSFLREQNKLLTGYDENNKKVGDGLSYVPHGNIAARVVQDKLKKMGMEERTTYLNDNVKRLSFLFKQRKGKLTLRDALANGFIHPEDIHIKRMAMEALSDYYERSALKTLFDFAHNDGLVKKAPFKKRKYVSKQTATTQNNDLRSGYYKTKDGKYYKLIEPKPEDIQKWRKANVPDGWIRMGPTTTGISAKEYKNAYVHPLLAQGFKEMREMREFTPSNLRTFLNSVKIAQFVKPSIIWVHDIRQHFMGGAPILDGSQFKLFWKALKTVYHRTEEYDILNKNGVYQAPNFLPKSEQNKMIDIALKTIDPNEKQKFIGKVEKILGTKFSDVTAKNFMMLPFRGLSSATWFGDQVIRTWTYNVFQNMGMPEEIAREEAGRVHGAYSDISQKYKKWAGMAFFVQTFRILMPREMIRLYVKDPLTAMSDAIYGKPVPIWKRRKIINSYVYLVGNVLLPGVLLASRGWRPDKKLWKWRKKVNVDGEEKELVIASGDFFIQPIKYFYRAKTYSPINDQERIIQGFTSLMRYEIHPFWRSLIDFANNKKFLEGGKIYDPNASSLERGKQTLSYFIGEWYKLAKGIQMDIDTHTDDKDILNKAVEDSMTNIEKWIFARNVLGPWEKPGSGTLGYTYIRGSRRDWIINLRESLELEYRKRLGEINASIRRGLSRQRSNTLIKNLQSWRDRVNIWIDKQEDRHQLQEEIYKRRRESLGRLAQEE